MTIRILVIVLFVLGASVPANASEPLRFECHAEVTPRLVTSGTKGQSFTLNVSNGPSLPIPVPTEEIDVVRVTPPIGVVAATSASAPSPWRAQLVGTPSDAVFDQGEILLGGNATFSIAADITGEMGTFDWLVEASRNGGQNFQRCQPAFAGALDITVT